MSLFEKLTDNEIVEAVSFFPALKMHPDLVEKTSRLTTEIDKKTQDIESKSKSDRLKILIQTYFKLNAYKELDEEPSLTEWMTQFIFRKRLIHKIEYPKCNFFRDNSLDVQEQIFALINKPIIDYKNRKLMYGSHSSISNLNLSELKRMAESYISDGSFKCIDEIYYLLANQNQEVITDPRIEPSDKFDLPYKVAKYPSANERHSKVIAVIDLDIDDAQLKKEFSAYLNQMREELKVEPLIEKSLKNTKQKSWASHRVLQYLDIKILDLYINGRDTLSVLPKTLASYIFPYEDTSLPDSAVTYEDKIRRDTIRYANEMMSSDLINRVLSDESRVYMGSL